MHMTAAFGAAEVKGEELVPGPKTWGIGARSGRRWLRQV